jgi:hypothetical protein
MKISRSQTIFIEDGIFNGINTRTISSNSWLAELAKAELETSGNLLATAQDFDFKLLVLLDDSLYENFAVDLKKRVIVSGMFFPKDFRGAMSDMRF